MQQKTGDLSAIAQQAMRESEGRFRAFVNATTDVVYRMSPDWSELHQLDGRGILPDTTAPTRSWRETYLLPEDREAVDFAIKQAIDTRSLFELEHRVVRADGTTGWTSSRAAPVINGDGEIVEWLGTATDVTARRQAAEALRESEATFRAVFETMVEVCCIFDMIYDDLGRPVDWRILEANSAYETQSGLKDVAGKLASKVMPGTEPYWIETFARVADTGRAEQIEKWHQPTGRWIHSSTARVGGPGSRRLASVFYDITERKLAEEALRNSENRAHLLLAELQHRVRNILFVVRSVFTRTVETGESLEEVANHFRGRLDALARTQAVVAQNSRGVVDLEAMIRDELLSVGARDGPNLSITGPDVELTSEAAESLGLVIHELTTNSIKYGALRHSGAKLKIRWSLDPDEAGAPHLVFNWVETGVSLVADEAGRGGFGTELITQALPYRLGAETSFEVRSGGVRCLLDVPMPAAQDRTGEAVGV